MNERQIYEAAVAKWGTGPQMGMLVEECAELIQSTMKLLNRNESPGYSFFEELADVEIMLGQMRVIFGDEAIDITKKEKLLRLQGLLEKEER